MRKPTVTIFLFATLSRQASPNFIFTRESSEQPTTAPQLNSRKVEARSKSEPLFCKVTLSLLTTPLFFSPLICFFFLSVVLQFLLSPCVYARKAPKVYLRPRNAGESHWRGVLLHSCTHYRTRVRKRNKRIREERNGSEGFVYKLYKVHNELGFFSHQLQIHRGCETIKTPLVDRAIKIYIKKC